MSKALDYVSAIVNPRRDDASTPRAYTRTRADGTPLWQRADGETREAFEARFMAVRGCYPTLYDYRDLGLGPTRSDAAIDSVIRSTSGAR